MLNSTIMYLVQSENEIPQQILPNTAYYIIGREVRVFDNAGQQTTFILPPHIEPKNELEGRLEACETRLDTIWKYLSGFGGDSK